MWATESPLTFQRSMLPPFLGSKIVSSSELSVDFKVCRYIPEDKTVDSCCYEYISPSLLVVLHTWILAERTYFHSVVGNLAAHTLIRYTVPLPMNLPVRHTTTSAPQLFSKYFVYLKQL
jgi:hypothetical protein